jgi:RNA-binding protein
LTDNVLEAADSALRIHELIKVRMASTDRRERRELAAKIAVATHSELAGVIGRVAIFYRAAEDPDQRKIRLPSAGTGGPGSIRG